MSVDSKRVTEAQVRSELTRMDGSIARRRAGICAAVIVAAALMLGALATRFLFATADIRTDGMADALASGDMALCLRTDNPIWPQEIRHGALALVRYEEEGIDRLTVRRLIGLAGDEIWVDEDGRVTLNGEALDESYATYCSPDDLSGDEVAPGGALENPFFQPQPGAPVQQTVELPETAPGTDDMDYPLTVPEGAAFVLCDNRNNRLDSRSSRFGLVAEADIKGVARAIIWPVYRAGLLDDGPAAG